MRRSGRKPSFGKELFLGDFRLDLIHPQPTPDPAGRRGEAFLERCARSSPSTSTRSRSSARRRSPTRVIQGLEELGALGMKIPEEYGGLGSAGPLQQGAGPGRHLAPVDLDAAVGAPVDRPAEPLRIFGTEEQKREWLPKLATDHVSAFLLTEPDVGSDPARMSTTAVPTEDGTGYRINGMKLWATNGAIADVVVVMAVVPKSEGHKGGITAFICPCDREGITVEHRNEFMGLRGIENSVTRFDDVFVPREDVIGGEGKGLRIALTTLNTGRLSLPAICLSTTKYSLKIAREWSAERKQWGQPIGRHDPVAQKLAWLAGTAFGLEAMLDVSSRLADDKRNDIRIEAALAKLYGSELGWTAVDEMVQIRGGRAYETAESLARRGEKPVPAEQMLRDMRINRIFEGSTEIMHLLIAREAVDQHLQVAGDLVLGDAGLADKARAAAKAGAFYATWFPTLTTAPGSVPAPSRSSASWPSTCATSSATRASSRARPSTRWAATRRASSRRAPAGPDRRHRRRALRDGVRVRLRGHHRPRAARPPAGGRRAGRPVLRPGPPPGRPAVHGAVGQRRRRPVRGRAAGARRPLRVVRAGRARPGGRWPDDADARTAGRRAVRGVSSPGGRHGTPRLSVTGVDATSTHRGPRVPRRGPYLLSSPGAVTALTIDLISRPAAAAAAAAIAEDSRRFLWLTAPPGTAVC